METYSTEEEQLEALRRWWDDNGKSLIVGVVVAIAASAGWQYWQKKDLATRESASVIYQEILQSTDASNAAALAEKAQQLVAQYPDTTYANFAALYLARVAVEKNNLPEAQRHLRWLLSNSPSDDERRVAQLRLARVQAATGDYDAALAILSGEKAGAYAASYAIAEGDVLMMAQRNNEAKLAYEKARLLIEQVEGAAVPVLLEQKLASLSPIPPRQNDAAAE